jgi:spermidine synthase
VKLPTPRGRRAADALSPTLLGGFSFLLLLSGYCSVSYELLWLRSLHLILGSDSLAVALVLAAFMAGLGSGSWWFGRVADRRSPLVLYRWLELGIGVYALASPLLLTAGSRPYRAVFRMLDGSPTLILAAKFLLGFALLAVPTFLMGGTLPAAVRLLADRFDARGSRIALVYGVNTLGAASAALLVPFVLLPSMDQQSILVLTALGNAAIFAGTFLLRPPSPPASSPVAAEVAPTSSRFSLLPFTLFLTGFVSIALETVWNRLFSLHLTSSIYTFSLVLAVYLAAVGAGSLLLSHSRLRKVDPGRLFAATQLAIALLILVQVLLFDKIALLQLRLLDQTTLGFASYMAVGALLTGLMTGPINLLFGLSFPSALAFLTRDPGSLGARTGLLAALNTLGTTAASLVVTFVGYRLLGSRGILLALAALALLTFLLLPRETRPARWGWWTAGCVVLLLALVPMRWNLANFHLLLAQKPDWTLDLLRKGELDAYRDRLEILAFREDGDAVVSVGQDPDGKRTLYINGKPDASDNPADMQYQFLCGHLPFLYRSGKVPPKVFVLGLGSGLTTHAASLHHPASLTTCEISPAVVECARTHFARINGGLSDAGTIRVEDGRHYLQTTDRRFDVIISEPSNPWLSGMSNMFTEEFFQVVRSRLEPGGIFCQWFHYYRMDYEYVLGLVTTLRRTFPHINVYLLTGDLMLIASERPLALDREAFFAPEPAIRETLREIGIVPPEALVNSFQWNEEQVASLRSSLPPNRDGRSWLEFNAPKLIFEDRAETNQRLLQESSLESAPPLELNLGSDGRIVLPEVGLSLPKVGDLRPLSYRIVRRTYEGQETVSNALFEARLEDRSGGRIVASSPILTGGPLNPQATAILLRSQTAGWPTPTPVTVTLPRHQYLAVVSDGPPFRWAGAWNCEKSGRSYALTVDSVAAIPDRDLLLRFLEEVRCHR